MRLTHPFFRRLWLCRLSLGLALLGSCVTAQGVVVVEDASLAPTLTGNTTAVLTLRLTSDEALQLFDAKSPMAVGIRLSNFPLQDQQTIEKQKQLHQKVDIAPFEQSIPIPPNKTITLGASTAHLRLIGIPAPLRINQMVPISLYFLDKKSNISILRVVARVKYQTPEAAITATQTAASSRTTPDPAPQLIVKNYPPSILMAAPLLDPIPLPLSRPQYQAQP